MTNSDKVLAVVAVPFLTKVAHAGEKGGIVVSVLGGLTSTELAAFGGLAVAVLSWFTNAAINFYFKWQHLKLARQLAQADQDE